MRRSQPTKAHFSTDSNPLKEVLAWERYAFLVVVLLFGLMNLV